MLTYNILILPFTGNRSSFLDLIYYNIWNIIIVYLATVSSYKVVEIMFLYWLDPASPSLQKQQDLCCQIFFFYLKKSQFWHLFKNKVIIPKCHSATEKTRVFFFGNRSRIKGLCFNALQEEIQYLKQENKLNSDISENCKKLKLRRNSA